MRRTGGPLVPSVPRELSTIYKTIERAVKPSDGGVAGSEPCADRSLLLPMSNQLTPDLPESGSPTLVERVSTPYVVGFGETTS
jgi:hypothetical protein